MKAKKLSLIVVLLLIVAVKLQAQLPPGMFLAEHDRDSTNVYLSWLEPQKNDWISYNNDIDTLTTGFNGNYSVAIKLDTVRLNAFIGMRVSQIEIIPTDNSIVYQSKVWSYDRGLVQALTVQSLDDIVYGEWNTINLLEDIYIDGESDLLFGYVCSNANGNADCYSTCNVMNGYTGLITIGGSF